MTVAYVHLYADYAVCSDGTISIRVPLTEEQIVQLAAEAAEYAARILRWEGEHVQSGNPAGDAAAGIRGRGR